MIEDRKPASELSDRSSEASYQRRLLREKLAAVSNPIRLAIVSSLSERPASVAELAEEIEVPVERARYHLNRMLRFGLVQRQGPTNRRGVSEQLYSADPAKLIIETDEAVRLPVHRLDEAHLSLLRLMFRETRASTRAGKLGLHEDQTMVRLPISFDARAWAEAKLPFTTGRLWK